MKKLTKKQKQEIVWGIENEGFEYYFCDYTHEWEEVPSEISELVKAFTSARDNLAEVIDSWGIEVE